MKNYEVINVILQLSCGREAFEGMKFGNTLACEKAMTAGGNRITPQARFHPQNPW